ncbi:MAG: VOC family protein [Ilumatobacteraceae bacterium]
MPLTVNTVTFDAGDPVALAGFWSSALGAEVVSPGPFIAFVNPPGGPNLMFLQVEEPKTSKNRCHLDLHADDEAGVDAEAARLVGAGASVVDTHREFGIYWTTLLDPEGNEFCIGTPVED